MSNVSLLQHIHKPIIPQLNYTIIEKKHNVSTVKSNIEHKPQQLANKASCLSKINNEHKNIYATNFQQSNSNIIPSEEYDPLAVTFIEPKNQMSKLMSPLSTNPEPKSLDFAPVNDSFETFDDEFSDFQCAQFTITDSKNNQEFTDFQSAFDTLSFKGNTTIIDKTAKVLNETSADVVSSLFENQQNVITIQDDILDKYEVFRTLAAETDDVKNIMTKSNHNDFLEVKPVESIKENVKNDVFDDEFGDFLCVEEVVSNKPDIEETDWKNVQVRIFHFYNKGDIYIFIYIFAG